MKRSVNSSPVTPTWNLRSKKKKENDADKNESSTVNGKDKIQEKVEVIPPGEIKKEVCSPVQNKEVVRTIEKPSTPIKVKQEVVVANEESRVSVADGEKKEAPKCEKEKGTSATQKALSQLKEFTAEKKPLKKRGRASHAIRRQRFHKHFNKMLPPKNAVLFLSELRPGCVIKLEEPKESNVPNFRAQVEHNDSVLAVGYGSSKVGARNAAAEKAIKSIVVKAISVKSDVHENETNGNVTEKSEKESKDDLPWAGLASYAIHKMLQGWENEKSGDEVVLAAAQPTKKVKAPQRRKDLPANAEKLHPSLLINMMRPGVTCVEIDRTSKDNITEVTMGYEIDGQMYTGKGCNKKEGRREAARTALIALYDLKYTE